MQLGSLLVVSGLGAAVAAAPSSQGGSPSSDVLKEHDAASTTEVSSSLRSSSILQNAPSEPSSTHTAPNAIASVAGDVFNATELVFNATEPILPNIGTGHQQDHHPASGASKGKGAISGCVIA
ncbi:hypothetical protein C8R46DRAFT_1352179 [Mycena filopes]|nr:hypothetical protein C8R46DRAFT_1352179 [Mycena filopes]